MGELVNLVEFGLSRDTIAATEILLSDAKGGPLIGLAYIAMYRGGVYVVDIAGETKKSPTFTRGMLCLLDDELKKIIRGR